jgi:mxaL protein
VDHPSFYDFVQKQKPAASFVSEYSIRWLYLLLAFAFALAVYLPNLFASHFGRAQGQ